MESKLLFDIYNGKVSVHVYNRPWLVVNVGIHVNKILRAVNTMSLERSKWVDEGHYELLENVLELADELEVSLEDAIDDVLQLNETISTDQSDMDTVRTVLHRTIREMLSEVY